MARVDLDLHFQRIELLEAHMSEFIPATDLKAAEFRADLAGLLVVATVATYENCVKDVLVSSAHRHHAAFGSFAANNFAKLNSRIALSDLNIYAKNFDPAIHSKFKELLNKRQKLIDSRIGKNISKAYEQMLDWRHAFAHAGIRNTTIEEAMVTHNLAKRVLYVFDQAFT